MTETIARNLTTIAKHASLLEDAKTPTTGTHEQAGKPPNRPGPKSPANDTALDLDWEILTFLRHLAVASHIPTMNTTRAQANVLFEKRERITHYKPAITEWECQTFQDTCMWLAHYARTLEDQFNPTDLSGFMTAERLAAHLGKPIETIRTQGKRKQIKTIRINGKILYRP